MSKKVQLNICPNPNCEKAFDQLIIICDQSKNPTEKFYGCPHCFFKLDPTVTGSLKKIEKMIKVDPSHVTPLNKESVSDCPKFFGYLYENFSNSIIPRKCLDCEKMDECMKKIMPIKNNKRG